MDPKIKKSKNLRGAAYKDTYEHIMFPIPYYPSEYFPKPIFSENTEGKEIDFSKIMG